MWLWSLLGVLAALAGVRYAFRIHAARRRSAPRVDDDAVRRILETGTLAADDEPLDMREAARAEEEFWREEWDEPEEYNR